MAFRPPEPLRSAIEQWAAEHDVTMSEAIRRLVEQALAKGGKR